jgi:hypothetical protein
MILQLDIFGKFVLVKTRKLLAIGQILCILVHIMLYKKRYGGVVLMDVLDAHIHVEEGQIILLYNK